MLTLTRKIPKKVHETNSLNWYHGLLMLLNSPNFIGPEQKSTGVAWCMSPQRKPWLLNQPLQTVEDLSRSSSTLKIMREDWFEWDHWCRLTDEMPLWWCCFFFYYRWKLISPDYILLVKGCFISNSVMTTFLWTLDLFVEGVIEH